VTYHEQLEVLDPETVRALAAGGIKTARSRRAVRPGSTPSPTL
jgi:hypothetical protein